MRTMVEVAARLYDLCDYNGVYALVSGLQAHNIERIPSLSSMNLPGWKKSFVWVFSVSMSLFSKSSVDSSSTFHALQSRQ